MQEQERERERTDTQPLGLSVDDEWVSLSKGGQREWGFVVRLLYTTVTVRVRALNTCLSSVRSTKWTWTETKRVLCSLQEYDYSGMFT